MSKNLKDTAAMRLMNNMGAEIDAHDTYNIHGEHNERNTHDGRNAHNVHSIHNIHISTEYKSRRLNLLIQPSVADRLAKIATMKRTSVNDLINTVLRNYTETEQDAIDKYDEIFS